jgi:hypothetical protein
MRLKMHGCLFFITDSNLTKTDLWNPLSTVNDRPGVWAKILATVSELSSCFDVFGCGLLVDYSYSHRVPTHCDKIRITIDGPSNLMLHYTSSYL